MTRIDRNSGVLYDQEKFSADEITHYQEGFLRDVVGHAYSAGTPLKHAMDRQGMTPEDVRTLGDLAQLPVTRKSDLSEAQKKAPPFGGFCTVPAHELVRIHQSPGPIYDPVGRVHDYWRWKTALYSVGFRPGDIIINTFAYHLTPAGHMFEEGVSELGAATIPAGVGNTETQVQIIKCLGVTGYMGTPSFLSAVIKKAEDMGIDVKRDCRLQMALLLAEMVPESMRRRFSERYNIIGRQAYGTADVGCLSYECPAVNGMHIHYDVIVEICNPDTGEPMPLGEPGEVVVTCNNKIYPLVRFGTGDLSSLSDGACSCGRTMPRLTKIMGRTDQLTKVKGMFVHPSQVEKVLAAHPEISRGRLLVEHARDRDLMTLQVELTGPASEGLVATIEQTLQEQVKLKGSVRVLDPGTLPRDFKTIDDIRKWD